MQRRERAQRAGDIGGVGDEISADVEKCECSLASERERERGGALVGDATVMRDEGFECRAHAHARSEGDGAVITKRRAAHIKHAEPRRRAVYVLRERRQVCGEASGGKRTVECVDVQLLASRKIVERGVGVDDVGGGAAPAAGTHLPRVEVD